MAEASLVATDVEQSFGSVTVIESVSMSLEAGSLAALVGPNGSGKTTLLRTLAGLLEPDAGEVDYRVPDSARSVGYLPQQPTFRPGFTARETLAFYTTLVGSDQRPEAVLERVGLSDAADRRVEALSGGMTRLLGLAQATIGEPPVVMLDEPGSGLDPGMRRRTFEVAHALAEEGAAVLVTSHDLALVEKWCDRVSIIDGGSVVRAGPVEGLCEGSDGLQAVFDSAVEGATADVEVLGVTD
jgi:ABC-type multidrug transport system ATPase subunit